MDYRSRIRLDRYAIKDPHRELQVDDLVVASIERVFEREARKVESREIGRVAACWNDHTYQNQQEWAGSPGWPDYINTPLGSLNVSSTGVHEMPFNSDGLDAIESRLSEDDIEFIWIASDYSTSKTFRWYSSEASTPTDRPYLYVEYTVWP